jgi:hypothetical protein
MACAGRDANVILTVQHTQGWWRLEVEDDVDVGVDEVEIEEAVTSGHEYASQKPDRRHPCRLSDHRRWFGDTALPRPLHGGRRNGRSSDGGARGGVDEKASCGVSLPVKRTSPFIEKALNRPCFDLPDIQEPPPDISWRPSTKPPHVRGRAYPALRADVAV